MIDIIFLAFRKFILSGQTAMGTTIIFMFSMLSTFATANDVLKFIEDYTADEFFWTPVYNTIDCFHPSEIKWTRLVSSAWHGFLGVHKTSEPLSGWVNTTEKQTFFLNVLCPGADAVLEQANTLGLFRSPFYWLLVDSAVFDEEENTTDTELESKWYWESLRSYNVLLDAEVRMSSRGENGTIDLFAAYKTSRVGELIKEYLGDWSPVAGLNLQSRRSTAIRRWDIGGAPLTGSIVLTHPETLNHFYDMVDKHIDPITKVGYVLVKHVSEMINASLEMTIRDTWGVNMNGTWTGEIGDIQSGAVEVGVSPSFVLSDRMEVVHYYEMITPTRAKFIFLSPPLSFSSNIFAMPFDRKVWICCLIMVVISSILLWYATRLEIRTLDKGDTKTNDSGNYLKDSLSDIVILNIGAICTQGAAVEPRGDAGRIITLFLYFSYMFLYVSYSGSIVSLLQTSDTSIRTFQDLLDSPLAVAADDIVYSQYYFKTESEPIRKALYEKKIAPKGEKPHFVSVEDGIKNLRKGFYAFHVETSVGYSMIQKTFTEEEKCGLQEFKYSFYQTVDPYLPMRIHTPFAEHMKIGMKVVIERGLNHRALNRIYTKKPICSAKSSRFVSVGLIDCYHAFITVGYGMLLAWVILLLEHLLFDQGYGGCGILRRTEEECRFILKFCWIMPRIRFANILPLGIHEQ